MTPAFRPSVLILLACAALAGPPPSAAVASPGATPGIDAARPAETLRIGSRGWAVRRVQHRLGLRVDGVYGRATWRAVKRFQLHEGLPATGRVDAATRAALDAPTGVPVPGDIPVADLPEGPSSGVTGTAALLAAVRSAVGRPYRAGAAGPDAFDCSGLVAWAAAAAGVDVPRTTFAQYRLGVPVAPHRIAAGDLVFFDTNGPGASDVGVATGADTAISATTHGVREHPLAGPYWGAHLVGARRLTA